MKRTAPYFFNSFSKGDRPTDWGFLKCHRRNFFNLIPKNNFSGKSCCIEYTRLTDYLDIAVKVIDVTGLVDAGNLCPIKSCNFSYRVRNDNISSQLGAGESIRADCCKFRGDGSVIPGKGIDRLNRRLFRKGICRYSVIDISRSRQPFGISVIIKIRICNIKYLKSGQLLRNIDAVRKAKSRLSGC